MNSDNVAQTASEMLEKDVQFTAEEEAAEQEAFAKVIQAMGYYRTSCEASLEKKRLDLAKVPDHQTPLTEGLQRRLDFMQNRIIRNQAFLKMLSTGPHLPYSPSSDDPSKKVAVADIDKVKSLLRQFVRDWSNQGQSERDATYTPILGALQLEFSDVPLENRGQIRVLVPGAGLGRLAFDSARLGFSTQGNEFSFYMLLASDFILNQTSQAEEFELYPWIHSFSNHTCTDHVMQRITVPDVVPGNIPPLTDFSMIAGEFIQVYGGSSQKGKWDAIATCYFIDTAHNILQYIEVIANLLKDGGIWINLGPLLYHFEGMQTEPSIELTLDEVQAAARSYGFVFEKEDWKESSYASCPEAMLQYEYHNAFWVARKMESARSVDLSPAGSS